MASTNKTENMGLNQWVASDAVEMEDFNADNLAIESAFARKTEFVKLKTVSVSAEGLKQVDVDVSDINFPEWQYVMVDVTISHNCRVLVDNRSASCYQSGNGTAISGRLAVAGSDSRITFMPCGKGGRIYAITHGNNAMYFGYCDYKFSQMKTLNFISIPDNNLSGGAEFVFWGIK